MATVNSDVLLLTLAGIKTEFDAAYIKAQEVAKWQAVATEIPTTLPTQNYAWLGRGAIMTQFYDEAQQQSVREDSYALTDIVYKGNLVIQRKTLEDDQYGLILMRARNLASEPIRHWNQLAFTGLSNGFSALGYDGLSFFNSSHQEGNSPTQSNVSSASLSDPALQTAAAAMAAYVDDKGVPLEIVPNTLVVGPALERKAMDLCGSMVVVQQVGQGAIGSGATTATNFDNYFKGRYQVVVSPYLINGTFNGVSYTAAYNWFLLDASREVKPIVIQSRQDVPITLETDMDEPSAKIKEEYQITVRGRYVQGYGLWQTAYGSNATS